MKNKYINIFVEGKKLGRPRVKKKKYTYNSMKSWKTWICCVSNIKKQPKFYFYKF